MALCRRISIPSGFAYSSTPSSKNYYGLRVGSASKGMRHHLRPEICPRVRTFANTIRTKNPVLFRSAFELASRNAQIQCALHTLVKRGYAKDVEYPDWEQYEFVDDYEYTGEMHEDHMFWDWQGIIADWDNAISAGEAVYLHSVTVSYLMLFLLLHVVILYLLSAIMTTYFRQNAPLYQRFLFPNALLWEYRGYSPEFMPPMPEGKIESLEKHNIYTLPNAWDAINDRPGVPNL